LARQVDFVDVILTQAIRATFDRRATPRPKGVPFGLAEDFSQDRQQHVQWQAFLNKNALEPMALADILDLLRDFLLPPLRAAQGGARMFAQWHPGDSWR
jgi:hypothetical protein